MSNVLIGIIGVILFIGLALAGALFLGPRFQQSTLDSKAAAVQQMVSQMANAAAMYQVESGQTLPAGPLNTANRLYPGYLKSIPNNPMRDTGGTIGFLDPTGGQDPAMNAKTAIMVLNGDDASKAMCERIDRAAGRTAPDETFNSGFRTFSNIVGNAGCQSNGTDYIVFVKI